MNTEKKSANAIGAKTARACDSCVKKRARWYCPSDDAFLCQNCDSSVHSANPLAQRHERVQLKTSSFDISLPVSWHQGFTRKARTPRNGKPIKAEQKTISNPLPLVPQLDETSLEESEDQLLYRVPIFDPFLAEFCSTPVNDEIAQATSPKTISAYHENADNLHGLLPTDMDLAEFAADVESLLGIDENSFDMEGLGLLNSKEEDITYTNNTSSTEYYFGNQTVKVEKEEEEVDQDLDMCRETLDLNFDYDSSMNGEEEKEADRKVEAGGEGMMIMVNSDYKTEEISKRVSLKLDYQAIITSWASQGSPWITGDRPDFNPDNNWPNCVRMCSMDVQHAYGDVGGGNGNGDGGREARVSRYREKRRTRLFSKKIRYEVRKLNAEKRPRMKGRFVKRSSLVGPGFPF